MILGMKKTFEQVHRWEKYPMFYLKKELFLSDFLYHIFGKF